VRPTHIHPSTHAHTLLARPHICTQVPCTPRFKPRKRTLHNHATSHVREPCTIVFVVGLSTRFFFPSLPSTDKHFVLFFLFINTGPRVSQVLGGCLAKMVRLVLRGRQDHLENKELMGQLVLRAKRGLLVNQAKTALTVCRVCLVIHANTHTLARKHTSAIFHSTFFRRCECWQAHTNHN
jgi:hypothetical protein